MIIKNEFFKIILIIVTNNLITYTNEYYITADDHPEMTLNNFTFGSCFYGRESVRFDIFNIIDKHKPQMWMWLGDAAYVDEDVKLDYWKSTIDVNFTLAEEIFNGSKNNEYYKLLNQKIPTIGVWDDHDYAINDGNGYFLHKEKAKKLFLDFMDEPEDSIRRTPNRPIYTSYSFGNKSTHKTVRIILLDVRYNKSSVFDKDADMLGKEQWKWFEEVLSNNNETFTFIASGTQILPFNRLLSEAWYGYSRKRLFDLLGKLKKSGVILLSGDIHQAEILKTYCILPEVGYDLYEICSSGLSHYDEQNFLFSAFLPTDYLLIPTISNYNFAKIEMDWGRNKNKSKIKISIVDIDNLTRAAILIKYEDLVYDKKRIKDPLCYEKMTSRFKSFKYLYEHYSNDLRDLLILWPWLMLIHFVYIVWKLLYFILIMIYKILYRKKIFN